jgi:YadA-like membrane anchor domain
MLTSNSGGDLAAYTPGQLGLATTGDLNSINTELNVLRGQNDKALAGVAMAFAMAGVPTVLPGETFVMTANWGNFEGENGLAAGAAIKVGRRLQLNGGVAWGVDQSVAGGRVGARVGW